MSCTSTKCSLMSVQRPKVACKSVSNGGHTASSFDRGIARRKSPRTKSGSVPSQTSLATQGSVAQIAAPPFYPFSPSPSQVFICGSYPHWLIMTQRGTLRGHPMAIDGTIPCFTAFHNVNCPKGFLYFSSNEELRICVLPTHLSYDAPWPVRKVPLRCTPHFVVYHPDSKVRGVPHAFTCDAAFHCRPTAL